MKLEREALRHYLDYSFKGEAKTATWEVLGDDIEEMSMELNPKLLQERKRVFNTYTRAFEHCGWAIVPPSIDGDKESSYHIYALRIKGFTEEQRDRMIDEIAKSEVAVNVHFIPMPMLSFFNSLGYDIKNYPQAYDNFKGEISLPIYPQLDEEKLAFIVDVVKAAYHKVAGDKIAE